MNLKQLKANINQAHDAFLSFKILEGLEYVQPLVSLCESSSFIAQLEAIRVNYTSMLAYLAEGGEDSNRAAVQADLAESCLTLLNKISRSLRLHYGTDCYCRTRQGLTEKYPEGAETQILEAWNREIDQKRRLDILDDLFDLLWTMPLWKESDTARWYVFIAQQNEFIQQHLVGAITLSLNEYLDAEKLTLLTLLTESEIPQVKVQAYLGIILTCHQYEGDLPRYNLRIDFNKKDFLHYTYQIQQNVYFLERTRLTLEEEAKELHKHLNLSTISEANKNSEYSSRLMEKVLTIKLKYAKFIVENYLDAAMSRASLLHSSRFLRKVSHWWLPFDTSLPWIQEILIDNNGKANAAIMAIIENPGECNVDKYALCDLLHAAKSTEIPAEAFDKDSYPKYEYSQEEDHILRLLTFNAHRFFNHSHIKAELSNPLDVNRSFIHDRHVEAAFNNTNTLPLCLQMIGIGKRKEAIPILLSLMRREGATFDLLYLLGTCYYANGDASTAAGYFYEATLLNEEDFSCYECLQGCYQEMGKYQQQLECLKKMNQLKPDDSATESKLVQCLIALEQYEEALQILHKQNYTLPDNPATLHLIVLALIQLHKYEAAAKYLDRLFSVATEERWQVYLLAGHLELLQNHWDTALRHYKQFQQKYEKWYKGVSKKNATNSDNAEFAITVFDKEMELLTQNGISESDFYLMRDMILQ